MIDFYTADSSNGQRAAIMIEECGLPCTLHKLDLFGGEQRREEFLAINAAGTIPAIVDHDGPGGRPLMLAQSGAILLYLAMKTGRFFPLDPARRAEAFQWVMQATTDVAASSMGLFLLQRFAPDKSEANDTWFEERIIQQLRVADGRLRDRVYLAEEVSIADFALYPLTVARRSLIERAGDLGSLERWAAVMAARPGVRRGMAAAQ
jgi:GSH-dependent disulfide-bond oxidoreductase